MSPSAYTGAVIVVSDKVHHGAREDTTGPAVAEILARNGVDVVETTVVPEGEEAVAAQLDRLIAAGVRVIFTAGGTGTSPHNLTPEATARRLAVRLPGLETQILLRGLATSDKAGLSRGLVGLTSREPGAGVIVNAPGSRGGGTDAAEVIAPLLGSLLRQVDE